MAAVQFQYVRAETRPGEETPKNPDIEHVAGINRYELCE